MKESCYIAGKITGLKKNEYKANFETAKQQVKRLGLLPVSPTDLPHKHEPTWNAYMREDLRAMLNCSHVFAQSNWQESKGASIEVELAEMLGLTVIYQDKLNKAETII